MKILSGISVLALLIAGAATPSFATSISPGGVVVPGIESGTATILADTGVVNFNFGGDVGTVQEVVTQGFTGSPFAGDISFIYQITVSAGNILNLTTENFSAPGMLDRCWPILRGNLRTSVRQYRSNSRCLDDRWHDDWLRFWTPRRPDPGGCELFAHHQHKHDDLRSWSFQPAGRSDAKL